MIKDFQAGIWIKFNFNVSFQIKSVFCNYIIAQADITIAIRVIMQSVESF